MNTRFMSRLFSATEERDQELLDQVAGDIESAKANGSVEDDEMRYDHIGEGKVIATDKENGEHTLIEQNSEDSEMYEMDHLPDEELERFLHPVPGESGHPQVNPEDGTGVSEKIECHSVDPVQAEVSKSEMNKPKNLQEVEFSDVRSNNNAVIRIFSDQLTVERASELVTNTESPVELETMRFEKDEEDPRAVIVTDKGTGDQAKVILDGDELQVTELEQKNFKTFSNKTNMNVIRRKVYSHAEQFDPMYVVGIDTVNQVLVNSPVYTEEAANELAEKLTQMGLEGVNVFTCPDEARKYAVDLLQNNGVVEESQVGEEEAREFSNCNCTLYTTRFYTDRTSFMNKLFSEAEDGISATQDLIEDAIKSEDQLETEEEIITPIDESTAVVEDKDNGEFTVVELDGEEMNVEAISEDEAKEMMADKEFSEYDERAYGIVSGLRNVGRKMQVWGMKGGIKNPKVTSMHGQLIHKANRNMDNAGAIRKAAVNVGKFISENPKSILTTAGTVGATGAGLAAGSLLKDKSNSSVEEKTYGVKDVISKVGTKVANWGKKGGKQLPDKFTMHGQLMEKGGIDMKNAKLARKVAKTAGEFIEKNPKAASAIAATGATAALAAGSAGMYALGKRSAKEKAASDTVSSLSRYFSEDGSAEESIESVEDKAMNAIQAIQETAETAVQAIQEAKEAPVEGESSDIQEAQYSDKSFSNVDTLANW